jgi:hypothetical protein
VSVLRSLLSSKDSIIKDLRASNKFLSQELETAKWNIKVLESGRELLKARYGKTMDKAVCAGHLLMKKPGVVVPNDIVVDVVVASGTVAKAPASVDPRLIPPLEVLLHECMMYCKLGK